MKLLVTILASCFVFTKADELTDLFINKLDNFITLYASNLSSLDLNWINLVKETSKNNELPENLDNWMTQLDDYIYKAEALDDLDLDLAGFYENNMPMDKAINCGGTCEVPLLLNPLFAYGCWCNLGNQLSNGGGPPVDLYDEACKKMQLCIRCVELDTVDANGEKTCLPATHQYVSDFQWSTATFSNVANCEDDNLGDDCGTGLCMCELDWINTILQIGFMSNYGISEEFKHVNNFDPKNSCPTTATVKIGSPGPLHALACCGAYPDRAPYHPDFVTCCENDGKIFNPATQECCEDGTKSLGNC